MTLELHHWMELYWIFSSIGLLEEKAHWCVSLQFTLGNQHTFSKLSMMVKAPFASAVAFASRSLFLQCFDRFDCTLKCKYLDIHIHSNINNITLRFGQHLMSINNINRHEVLQWPVTIVELTIAISALWHSIRHKWLK